MVKRPSAKESVPSVFDECVQEKEQEELDLEERLFGTKKRRVERTSKAEERRLEDELGGLDDAQLFSIDAPLANDDVDSEDDVSEDNEDEESIGALVDVHGSGVDENEEEDDETDYEADNDEESAQSDSEPDDVGSDEDEDDDVDVALPEDSYDVTEEMMRSAREKPIERKSVWHDPSDDLIGIDLEEVRRLKKLARGKKNSKVGGAELQARLREQFERLHPRPEWADNRTRKGVPSLSSLFTSTKSFIDDSPASLIGTSRGPLPQGSIEMQRQRNANQMNPTAGKREASGAGSGVVDFAWHPNPAVPVGAVAGGDRRIRFFNIDGETNPTLLTLHIPSLPLTNVSFHPSGSTLLITGTRPYYYTYDLVTQRCLRSSRNLFGSSPSPSSPQSLGKHSFSPDGSLLAVAGRRGAVSILDWSTSGTGAVVAELVSGRGGSTADMLWGADGRTLEVLGGRSGSEVEIWDVGERQVVSKWADERAFGGDCMRRTRDGLFTAVGSSTGIINLYSSSTLRASTKQDSSSISVTQPEPLKSLEHLTTKISSLDFHPSGEILVGASNNKQKLLKMYHLPSGTAFSNWPTQRTPLGRITTTNFSPSGEYLTIGNQKGQVLLWSLNHFA